MTFPQRNAYFNPRSPYGERRKDRQSKVQHSLFQSTLPLRGATSDVPERIQDQVFQSTLPLRGATGIKALSFEIIANFNPRSPYGERHLSFCCILHKQRFQSTLPLRGATAILEIFKKAIIISIHAPLTGSDPRVQGQSRHYLYFNPRSPYGERQEEIDAYFRQNLFQSTLPLRGATHHIRLIPMITQISIHAPLTGSDRRNP